MINIYVGNLPYSVRSEELREAFEAYGAVASAEVIFDRRTKRSRGYGFVEMESEADGRRAIAALNGTDFKGRELRVDESQPKAQKEDGNGAGERKARKPAPAAQPQAAAQEAPGGVVGFFRRLFG